jgi:hypothetical protein
MASASGVSAFPASRVGSEYHACPSAALVHLSARLKSSEMSYTSCVANISSIFSSLMTCQNAITIEALEMREMVF